jgi:transcriptional regulator with XRE-family HTH domain
MTTLSLHERLSSVADGRTYRAIADLTDTHPETVRRYMQGQSPGVEFLSALCQGLAINADWLLTGRGPMRVADLRAAALRDANPAELHTAMATTLSSLVERVERLETYCQTLETKLRVAASPATAIPSTSHDSSESHIVETKRRATRVADALTRRPHPDAH